MKHRTKMLCLSASALALGYAVAPAPANAADMFIEPIMERTVTGVVDLYGGWSFLDGSGGATIGESSEPDDNYGQFGGIARADIPFNPNFSIQLDVDGMSAYAIDATTNSLSDQSGNYRGGFMAGGHLNYREVDHFLVGLFGGGGQAFVLDSADDSGAPINLWFAGVEGQMYFGDTTLYVQGGYMDSETTEVTTTQPQITNAFMIRAVGRHYFSAGEGLLEGEFLWITGDQDANEDDNDGTDGIDVVGWGMKAQHRIMQFGNDGYVSGYLHYRGRYFDETNCGSCGSYVDNTILGGISIAFNQPNVRQLQRQGVALDLPEFHRIIAGGSAID